MCRNYNSIEVPLVALLFATDLVLTELVLVLTLRQRIRLLMTSLAQVAHAWI